MNINSTQNSNQTSFGASFLFKVKPQAFETPKNLAAVSEQFANALKGLQATAVHAEQPVQDILIKSTSKSINQDPVTWANEHLMGELAGDTVDFLVFTKGEKAAADQIFTIDNIFSSFAHLIGKGFDKINEAFLKQANSDIHGFRNLPTKNADNLSDVAKSLRKAEAE